MGQPQRDSPSQLDCRDNFNLSIHIERVHTVKEDGFLCARFFSFYDTYVLTLKFQQRSWCNIKFSTAYDLKEHKKLCAYNCSVPVPGLHEWGEEGRPEADGEGERQGGIGGVGWGGALACCSGLGSSQKDFHTVPAYVSHAEKRFQSFDSATL